MNLEIEKENLTDEELEAAGFMYDVLAKEGWTGWIKRNQEALKDMRGKDRLD